LAEIAPKGAPYLGTTLEPHKPATTAYLENPTPAEFLGYQSARNVMYSIPDFIVETFKSPLMT
jgi:hypothetical protein